MVMESRKRTSQECLPVKRTKSGLTDVSNTFQLISPPVTPEKNRIIHFDVKSSGVRSLVFDTQKLEALVKPGALENLPMVLLRQSSVYSRAKNLFQKSAVADSENAHLVGREGETESIVGFVTKNLEAGTSSSLYISGPPGTGKTAQVTKILRYLLKSSSSDINNFVHKKKRVRTVHINCMTLIARPENVFHEIYCGLSQEESTRHNKRKTADDLQQLLLNTSHVDSLVVVLDELDCLLTKDQQVIFTLFRLAYHQHSHHYRAKLIILAISNALDLTDKFLPRLKANGMLPCTLQFLPYAAHHIKSIVELKLRTLVDESDKENAPPTSGKPLMGSVPIVHPTAIILCSKKAAAITGDLRKAFDIFYQSIEMVEEEQRKKLTPPEFDQLTYDNAPKVMITHVAKVCSRSFGDNSMSKLQSLNLHQKTVLCCLFNYYHGPSTAGLLARDITINGFYDFYTKHCSEHAERLLGKLRKGEFLDIISALESCSVVSVIVSRGLSRNGNQDFGNKTIKPNVTYEDFVKCIENIGVLRRILHGELP